MGRYGAIGPPCTTTNCPGWIPIDSGVGRPTQIAARPSNTVLFQRHEDGSIWKWDGKSSCDAAGKVCPGWTRINNDARTKDILASGSTVFQRLADGSIWKWDGKSNCDATWKVCPGWTRINNDVRTKEFTAGAEALTTKDSKLYQRLADGSVWSWDGNSSCDASGKVCPGWTRINADPRTAQIAAGGFSELFMRQDNGAIWKWDGKSSCDPAGKVCPGWTRINNDARTKDILASESTVFQRLADGSVWQWDGRSPCDAAGKVCPGWAPPLNRDLHTKSIVPFDPIRPPSPPGPK
jgi:hypothetical protein